MILRKVNAALSLLTTLLLMDHVIFLSVWMLSRCSIEKSADSMPYVLTALMAIHAILSILIEIRAHKEKGKGKVKPYVKLNRSTYIQRCTGILMLLLLGVHIAGAVNNYKLPLLHAVLGPVFFAIVLAHVSVSTSKALITLGIGNAKVVKIVNIAMRIMCSVMFAAGIVGFYIYLFVEGVR